MAQPMSPEANGAAPPTAHDRNWTAIVILFLALALLFALLLRLGFWQLGRASYKDELSRRFAHNEAQPVQAPTRLLQQGDAVLWQFRRTRVEGVFEVNRQYLLDNRTHAGRAGYHVLSVLNTSEGAVLVNRGWVETGGDRTRLPDLTLVDQPVSIVGRLVPPPANGLLLGDTGHESTAWPKVVQNVDLQAMGRQLGVPLLPALILLDASNKACFRCQWQPVAGVGADRHRGYAFQWFSLAVALVVLLALVGWRGWRRAGR